VVIEQEHLSRRRERAVKKQLLVLRAGTAGATTIDKLRRGLDAADWDITVVDRDVGTSRPESLLPPLGAQSPDENTRSRHAALIDGRTVAYDYLVIA